MIRTVTWALVAASLLAVGTIAVARNTANLTRRDIRSMPILERPSRPGHFYGNAVRRNYYRGTQRGTSRGVMPGTVWEGYSTAPRQDAWVETGETVVNE